MGETAHHAGESADRIVMAEQPLAVRPCSVAAALDILADRLRKLESAGIIERRPYSEHPPRYEYHLTQAGRELFPVMLALREWGDKWAVESLSVATRHTCGHLLEVDQVCRHCGEPVTRDTVEAVRAGQ